MKIRLFILAFLIMPRFMLAQSAQSAADGAAAKPLTEVDSLMVQDLFYSALREKTLENYTEAATLFGRVLQVAPENAAAMYELANIKRGKDDYAGAGLLLEHAVAISPDNKWYWLALADCYEKTNNIARIGNVFDQLIRLDPAKPDYYLDKANVFFIEKKYDDALKVYDQLEQITGPDDDILASRQKIYLVQGKLDKAVAQIQTALAENPGQVRYYLLLAELYNSNNFPDKAFKVLEDAEKINPDNGRLHLALADIYRDKKDYQACFNELKLAFAIPDMDIDQEIKIISGYFPKFPDPDSKTAALELSRLLTLAHPGDAKAFAIYGDMLYQNEKYKDAKIAYKQSLGLDASHYEVYEQLVRIEISDDETGDAIKDGEYALTLFPNQAWMNYLVGVAYLQKKEYNKALSYLTDAAAMVTDDKQLASLSYSSLGDCYHELQQFKNSDDAYDKALSYDPGNAYALNNYAYYLSVRGEQLDKAAQMSARSNELQPNTASFEDTYAWILFKQKKYADAKVWIEKAITHDKTNSAVQAEHYGDIMFCLGDTDAAVLNWKKAKSFGQQSPVLDRKINERKYIE